eukprot:3520398-Pleurochrysis_carterae.AAC.5
MVLWPPSASAFPSWLPVCCRAQVTLDQATGAFVLHVPREYDYILTAAHSGLSLAADGSSKEHALQVPSQRTMRENPRVCGVNRAPSQDRFFTVRPFRHTAPSFARTTYLTSQKNLPSSSALSLATGRMIKEPQKTANASPNLSHYVCVYIPQEYLQTETAGSAADFAAHVIVALKSLCGDWQARGTTQKRQRLMCFYLRRCLCLCEAPAPALASKSASASANAGAKAGASA